MIEGKLSIFLKNIDICLKCNFEDKSPVQCISIFLGHGFPVKRNNIPQKYFNNIDHFFLYGRAHRAVIEYYMRKARFNKNKIKFWNIGYPNYDDQINNSYNLNKIKKKYLSINNNKPNILYSPAWENRNILSEDLEKIFEVFSNIKKYNFIIKFHPSLFIDKSSQNYNFYTGGIDWRKKLINAQKKYKNIYFYKSLKINPLFKLCKLMITDFSGVAIGFMIENKPVIFLNTKKTFNKEFVKLGYQTVIGQNLLINSGMNYGIKINNYSEIKTTIDKIFNNYQFYQKRTNRFSNNYLFNPGKATQVAYKTLNLIANI